MVIKFIKNEDFIIHYFEIKKSNMYKYDEKIILFRSINYFNFIYF